MSTHDPMTISVERFDYCYGSKQVLFNVNLAIAPNRITAFIGPSGCGKSTLLRCFNRMNDGITGAAVTNGRIVINGVDVTNPALDLIGLRRRVGMVFQKSNLFPTTIFGNVAYGLKIAGVADASLLRDTVEQSLRDAALWDEVKDRLDESPYGLSGGQQQRLCIARTIAVSPEILLMDEPCSALDPIATAKIEELICRLKAFYTLVIVTHNMQQATRIADDTAFFHLGELVEYGPTTDLFSNPCHAKTEEYITGRFS